MIRFSTIAFSLLLFLFPFSGVFALTYAGGQSGTFVAPATTGSVYLTVTGDNAVVFAAIGETATNGSSPTGCTYGGDAMTEILNRDWSTSRKYRMYALAVGTGNATSTEVKCDLSGATDYGFGVVASYYTGAKQTDLASLDAITTYTSAGTMTTELVTTVDNSWLVGFAMGSNGTGDLTAGAGTTQRLIADGGTNYYDIIGFFDSGAGISPAGSSSQIVVSSNVTDGALYVLALEPVSEATSTPPGWNATTTPASDSDNLHFLVGLATFALILFMFDVFRRHNAGLIK